MSKLQSLRATNESFEVLLTNAEYKVKVKFYIHDVEERFWHRFEATKPTVEDLKRAISDHLTHLFADMNPTDFRSTPNSHWQELLSKHPQDLKPEENNLRKFIRGKSGLDIIVELWVREPTLGETEIKNPLLTEPAVEPLGCLCVC